MANQSWRILDLFSRWFVILYSLVQYIPHSITIWVMSFTLFRSNFLYIKVSKVTNFPLYFLNSVLKHHEFNMYSPEIKHGTWTSPITKQETYLPNPSFLASNIFISRRFWYPSPTLPPKDSDPSVRPDFQLLEEELRRLWSSATPPWAAPKFLHPKKTLQGPKWPPFFLRAEQQQNIRRVLFFCCLENVLIEFFKTKSSVFKQKYQHFHFGMVVFFNVERWGLCPQCYSPKLE